MGSIYMKKTKFLGVITLICICFGIALLTDLPKFLKYQKGDIKDFDSVAAGELKKGDLVQGTIDITDGCIAENEQTNKTMGIETSKRTTSRYYAVYMYNDMYILYETGNKEQYETLDKLADECEAYYDSLNAAYDEEGEDVDLSKVKAPETTMEFTAVVNEMPDDLTAIFREWYGEGFENDCETVMLTYSDFSSYLRFVIIGAGCVLLGIIFLVLTIISWRKGKQFSY